MRDVPFLDLPSYADLVLPTPDLIAGVDLAAQENAIRELLNQEVLLLTVLRLLCVYSIVSGGLKPKVIEEFKRDIVQVRLSRVASRSAKPNT